jgi:8-oxo-dGTP pyrophosphatase MutT (NUDIX family)
LDQVLAEGFGMQFIKRPLEEYDYFYMKANAGVCALAEKDGKFYLVEQYREPLGKRVIELPCGGATGTDMGTLYKNMIDEVRQEIGFETEFIKHIGMFHSSPSVSTERVDLFYVKLGNYVGVQFEGNEAKDGLKTLELTRDQIDRQIDSGVIDQPYILSALYLYDRQKIRGLI